MSGCNFYVGQKVVCVVDDLFEGVLKKGRVYTVTAIVGPYIAYSFDGFSKRMGLEIAEIANPASSERAFNAARFRPVVECKTDISIFTDMLIEQKHPVTA